MEFVTLLDLVFYMRRLNLRLDRPLSRRLDRCLTARTDGRSFRPPDYLAVACSALSLYLRQAGKMAKADPHIFGPHAAEQQAEAEAALCKVYGPPKPGDPPPASVWRERYYPEPGLERRIFLKWFKEQYG
jgi:hypothetical protein